MKRFWVPVVFLAFPILGPALFAMVIGKMPTLFFEKLFFKSLTLYGLSFVAWLVVAHIVPRIEPPSKRAKSLLVAGMVSFPIFVMARGGGYPRSQGQRDGCFGVRAEGPMGETLG